MNEEAKMPKLPTEVEEETALNPRIHAELAVRYYMHSAIYNPNLIYFYLDLLERIAEADGKIDAQEFEQEFKKHAKELRIDTTTQHGRLKAANLRLGMILSRYYGAQPITIKAKIPKARDSIKESTEEG